MRVEVDEIPKGLKANRSGVPPGDPTGTAHRSKVDSFVELEVRGIAKSLSEKHRNCTFTIMSSLADGADRLVAIHLLDALRDHHPRLVVPLPLPNEIYRETFAETRTEPGPGGKQITASSKEASFREFLALITRPECFFFELPMRFGSLHELGIDAKGSNPARNRQFALAGAYIVQKADELIVVLNQADGEEVTPPATGGARPVLQMWQSGIPPEYQFPASGLFAPKAKEAGRAARRIDVAGADGSG